MSEPTWEYTVPIEIRFADLDAYGHVNNALYLTYLETARIRLFREQFGEFLENRLMFLVVRAECDYRRPIRLQDTLHVTISAEQVKRSSFIFCYRLHDAAGTTFAEAKTCMACYDPDREKPTALPAPMRNFFLGQ